MLLMMERLMTGLLLLLVAGFAHAFIAPQEIPSILSLVYSNIPPVKKGTDSRVGFGYRLGEHADFQVLFELGPQTNTKPLGNSDSSSFGSDTSKRQVNQEDYEDIRKPAQKSPNPVGSKYLSSWSQDMKVQQRRKPAVAPAADDVVAIQTRPFIEESALRQLQQLYGKPLPVADGGQADAAGSSSGTLPAASMDAIVAQLNRKVRYGNSVVPKPKQPAATTRRRNEAKITADLSDIDLS